MYSHTKKFALLTTSGWRSKYTISLIVVHPPVAIGQTAYCEPTSFATKGPSLSFWSYGFPPMTTLLPMSRILGSFAGVQRFAVGMLLSLNTHSFLSRNRPA